MRKSQSYPAVGGQRTATLNATLGLVRSLEQGAVIYYSTSLKAKPSSDSSPRLFGLWVRNEYQIMRFACDALVEQTEERAEKRFQIRVQSQFSTSHYKNQSRNHLRTQHEEKAAHEGRLFKTLPIFYFLFLHGKSNLTNQRWSNSLPASAPRLFIFPTAATSVMNMCWKRRRRRMREKWGTVQKKKVNKNKLQAESMTLTQQIKKE